MTALICIALVSFASIQVRYSAALIGLLPTPQADAYTWSDGATQQRIDSNGTVRAPYCSEVVAASDSTNSAGLTSTDLEWDDRWFIADSRTYNHDIAQASVILSAVCNSESQFYGSVEGAAPYAEQTLGSLGFEDIHTESYALRSNPLDQLGALFSGKHDVAAYTFASKTIAGKSGDASETLVFVGIRGSYGVEWLSNFKFADFGEETVDHYGFKAAEQEVKQALVRYLDDEGIDASAAKFLITGHSRGGSIANLLAAEFDGESTKHATHDPAVSEENPALPASPENVFAYTFAAPCTTQAADRAESRYGNIFNIVNPSDIVPQLPLSTWGYGRYGTAVVLPEADGARFSSSYASMQRAFQANTGFANPCDEDALGELDSFGTRASTSLPSAESLVTIEGMAALCQSLLGVDYEMAFSAHYPDTYIAWMQSVSAGDLAFC